MARPKLACCRPWNAPYGSGHHWTHSRRCPDYPNQKVGQERAHPAGANLEPDRRVRGFASWNASPLIGPLDYWAAYFDSHLDDEDDERVKEGEAT